MLRVGVPVGLEQGLGEAAQARRRPSAVPIVASGSADVLSLGIDLPMVKWVGLAVLAIVAWLLYRTAMKPQPVLGEAEGGPR